MRFKWPEGRITPNLSTLRSLAKSRQARRNTFRLTAWFSPRASDSVRERLKEYASNTAEFAKVLDVIKEITATRTEDHSLEMSKYSSLFAGDGGEAPDYPSRVNRELHDVLSFHVPFCSCQHLTRLRLNPQDPVQEMGAICFEVLFSSQKTVSRYWNETKMLVPRYHDYILTSRLTCS